MFRDQVLLLVIVALVPCVHLRKTRPLSDGLFREVGDNGPLFGSCLRPNIMRDVVRAVVRQGGWDTVFVITDNSYCVTDGYSNVDDLAITAVTCDFLPLRLARAINSVPHALGEYFNIITDCDIDHIMFTMDHILNKDGASPEMRFNWLFIDLPTTSYRSLVPFLKDGDNVVIMTPSYHNHNNSQVVREVALNWCLTDCYKPTALHHIGTAESAYDISRLPVKLLPKQFEQFYGRELLIAYQEYKPYTYPVNMNGTKHVTGIEVELVRSLADRFNFTFRYVRPPDSNWGTRVNDSYWNGIIGMIMRGDADMGSSSMSLSAEREKVIDFLHPHREESSIMVTKLGFNKWAYFINVFETKCWIAIGCLPMFTSLTIVLMLRAHKLTTNRYRTRRKSAGSVPEIIESAKHTFVKELRVFLDYTFLCYGQLLLQGHGLPGIQGSVKFVIGGYWMTVLILSGLYMGNLTASLAIKDVRLPFNNLHELAQDKEYILVVEKGTHKEQLFRESKSGLYRDFWKKVSRFPSESLVDDVFVKFAQVLNYTGPNKYVFTGSKLGFMEQIRGIGACDVTLLREEYLKGGTALVVKEGVPYKRAFNTALMWIQSSGMLEIWTTRHLTRDVCKDTQRTYEDPVSLSDLTFVYLMVFGIGLGAAAMALVGEWFLKMLSTFAKYTISSDLENVN